VDGNILKFYRILGVLFLICGCGGDCGACQWDGCGGCTGGVTRVSLYRTLSVEGQPAFETVFHVVRSFGLALAVR
jgi:hypothetical protein